MSAIKFRRFPLNDLNGHELGFISIEHLWTDVFALKIKILSFDGLGFLEKYIHEALSVAKSYKARLLVYRLIKEEVGSQELRRLLPPLGFKRKNERIEYKKSVLDLPDDQGSPFSWKSAKDLNLNSLSISEILKKVSEGDPDTDPNDNPLQFIQDILADSVLTSGLECIHIGFLNEEMAALTVVQRNPKTGWCRISYMGVIPQFRQRNLGNWVHRYSFSVMKREGGVLYHGGTTSTNFRMIRLFENNGCVRFCEMEEWNLSFNYEVTV